jgi:hypothetical protein
VTRAVDKPIAALGLAISLKMVPRMLKSQLLGPVLYRYEPNTFRALTRRLRLLPDFVIIGAQKAGTTSLYNYLIQHPCVARARRKEVNFFDVHFSKGVSWYRGFFPLAPKRYFERYIRGREILTGEASTDYLFHPLAPRRMFEVIPKARLIVLLRNPVDRAYSHYFHEVAKGRENLPFDAAIDQEAERLRGEEQKIRTNPLYEGFRYRHYSYLARGIYIDQIKAVMDVFPAEQLLILKSEDFYAEPRQTFKQVLSFLRLPVFELQEYRAHNARKYPEMPHETRKRLIDYFRPHNERLYAYLGVDFGWD